MIQQLADFKPPLPRFPTHPSNPHNPQCLLAISGLVQKYHSADWIRLEDQVLFGNEQECMKRFYTSGEYENKIRLLGDYYRYHFQAPRIFLEDIGRIIQTNTEEKRALEYEIVSRELNKGADGKLSTARLSSHQRLIKDVELSYRDFECKPEKPPSKRTSMKHRESGRPGENMKKSAIGSKVSSRQITLTENEQRGMKRVSSIHAKGSFILFKPKEESNKFKLPSGQGKATRQTKPKKATKDENFKKKCTLKSSDSTKNGISSRSSKLNSVNNSMNSKKGLSRSKSRSNLDLCSNTLASKKMNSDGSKKKPFLSNQSSLKKTETKRSELSEKKENLNRQSDKVSHAGAYNTNKDERGKQSHKTITISGVLNTKKPQNENKADYPATKMPQKSLNNMFSKAIQIRNRKV